MHVYVVCILGGVSNFDFLELSESQGLGEVVGNSQEEEGPTAAQTDSQRHNKPGNNTKLSLLLLSPWSCLVGGNPF